MRTNTITNDNCRRRHNSSLQHLINNETLCAFARRFVGICNGDSGGPLAANGQLIGIVSWKDICARGAPDGFTRISVFLDWIREVSGVVPA